MFLIVVNIILSSLAHIYAEVLTDDDFQEFEDTVKKLAFLPSLA